MRFYGLTSIKIIPPTIKDYKFAVLDESKAHEKFMDYPPCSKFRSNHFENAFKYKLTEICCGFKMLNVIGEKYFLALFREDIDEIEVEMTPEIIYDVIKIITQKHVSFEFKIAFSKTFEGIKRDRSFDLQVKVRCIMNTSTIGMITEIEEEGYENCAKNIEIHASQNSRNPDGYLAAQETYIKNTPLKLGAESALHNLQTKIGYFENLVRWCCDSKTGDHDNVPTDADHYHTEMDCKLKNRNVWYKDNTKTDGAQNQGRNYRNCFKILFEHLNLSTINFEGFSTKKLKIINLQYVNLADAEQILKPLLSGNIDFSNMADLTLDYCNIQNIPAIIFTYLLNLTGLHLHGNEIEKIPTEISKLQKLEKLTLSYNRKLSDDGIPWDFFPQTFLAMSFTAIKNVPASISRLINLQHFYLASDFLQKISWKNINKNVSVLSVAGYAEMLKKKNSKAGATKKPHETESNNEEVNNLQKEAIIVHSSSISSNVTRLLFSNNIIPSFNVAQTLPFLTVLKVYNNGMTSIEWQNLPSSLITIDFSLNKLKEIGDIARLKNLEELNVACNFIKTISGSIGNLKNLKIIDFSKNKLQSLPEGFENFLNVEILSLSSNKFTNQDGTEALEKSLWNRLPRNIGNLDLNNNKDLREISCSLKSVKMKVLNIQHCNLIYICPYFYSHLQQLKDTDFTYRLYLNVQNNPQLNFLPFVPAKIYTTPLDEKLESQITFDSDGLCTMILGTNNPTFKAKRMFPKTSRTNSKPLYNFEIIKMDKEEINFSCSCCARCGIVTPKPPIKQHFWMDFKLALGNSETEDVFKKPKYGKGRWKCLAKTRMCQECEDWFKSESDRVYELSQNGEEVEDLNTMDKLSSLLQKINGLVLTGAAAKSAKRKYANTAVAVEPPSESPHDVDVKKRDQVVKRLHTGQEISGDFVPPESIQPQIMTERSHMRQNPTMPSESIQPQIMAEPTGEVSYPSTRNNVLYPTSNHVPSTTSQHANTEQCYINLFLPQYAFNYPAQIESSTNTAEMLGQSRIFYNTEFTNPEPLPCSSKTNLSSAQLHNLPYKPQGMNNPNTDNISCQESTKISGNIPSSSGQRIENVSFPYGQNEPEKQQDLPSSSHLQPLPSIAEMYNSLLHQTD